MVKEIFRQLSGDASESEADDYDRQDTRDTAE
jgi:hypothetical protein